MVQNLQAGTLHGEQVKQRPAQLVRVTVDDIDLDAKTILLHDPKGRRVQPRLHELPLTSMAEKVIKDCMARAARLATL